MADAEPGLTIGVSGPSRQRLTHRLIRFGLRLYGAQTLFIRPGSKVDVSMLDGLVLTGGTHVHPSRYGQKPEVQPHYGYDLARDETDWRLLAQAETLHLPVLGICRGAQLINIFRGGSLCQDITPLRVNTRHRPLLLPLQTVRLVRNSLVGQIMLGPTIGANRIHSQSIKRLGRGLRVVALDNDYFVQAVESEEGHWLLGVQWHPEYLLYHPLHRRIFEHFVLAVRAHKLRRLGHIEGPAL